MGVTYQTNLRNAIADLARAENEFKGMIEDGIDTLVPITQETMRMYSDMHKNRISEDMVNAMTAERRGFSLKFGFLGARELYYKLQTVTGFTHLGGKYIAPSLALKDTEADTKERVREMQVRIRRNFMQRLRRRG